MRRRALFLDPGRVYRTFTDVNRGGNVARALGAVLFELVVLAAVVVVAAAGLFVLGG